VLTDATTSGLSVEVVTGLAKIQMIIDAVGTIRPFEFFRPNRKHSIQWAMEVDHEGISFLHETRGHVKSLLCSYYKPCILVSTCEGVKQTDRLQGSY
jgi:hypothetical protein